MTERTLIEPGQTAPAFTAQDALGETVDLASLAGRRVILYFYPKASTPGCTKQACDFRDHLGSFTKEGFTVLGVSPDSPEALRRFAENESLTFPLLSDPDHEIASAYGAWGEKSSYGRTTVGLIRSTIVIDPEGRVELALYNVKATGHVARLRRELGLDSPQG
ncbi:thioredoxin-dependent thiol peroxidase [Falsarthrobacter nasiphocae]|uniref:thioredoxin-dependent peroxiredoxin n=1 Tax=Falsarthrobacter nasiphocae TaxID=189863 RepID=A0AAE4C7S2_9MICC|nr:thioredoxin-dependent thiol peroxidase [Falsarthrobacter nasiphocae]MDR6892809.1 peroxiredoxin Q/BCP [Falsarthrobacter nasiphocae]